MLQITKIIADTNRVTDPAKLEKLDNVLKSQATNGVTVQAALKGHCPQAALNPEFIDMSCSTLRNHDGVLATPSSPLMAFIHQDAVPDSEAAA